MRGSLFDLLGVVFIIVDCGQSYFRIEDAVPKYDRKYRQFSRNKQLIHLDYLPSEITKVYNKSTAEWQKKNNKKMINLIFYIFLLGLQILKKAGHRVIFTS